MRANLTREGNSPIRVAAKAVIIDDDQILLSRNLYPNDPDGEFFLLPGGGQNHGETLEECLRREVLEETGYSALVGDVLWVRDYIGANHDFATYEPDARQLSVDWIHLGDLPKLRFFPAALLRGLVGVAEVGRSGASYLGDVN